MKKSIRFLMVIAAVILVHTISNCADLELSELYMGNISISDTNIDVPLYYANASWEGVNQVIVDLDDAAAYQDETDFCGSSIPLIADHNNQNNFCELYDVIPDVSIACITTPDGNEKEYICREIDRNAENNEIQILDSDGNLATTKYASDWIAIYTCNPEGWWSITLTFWEPIN